jgi:DNA-3-methyladenine glycosylase II
MPIFEYGSKEIDHLKQCDKLLGAAIDQIGLIRREIIPDPFAALVSSIISQQISKQAAATISGRLYRLLNEVTPESIFALDIDLIRGCGLSERKAVYLKGIAGAAISKEVDFEGLANLSDQEVIDVLTALRGVGVWTAEMILIFSLCRPDILSYRDLAICRGLINLYGLTELPADLFEQYRKRYSPYGSVASLYLWALSA